MNFQKTLSIDNSLIRRPHIIWSILALFALCFVFYGNTIKNDYNLDDNYAYTGNVNATNGLSNIKEIFTENTFTQSTYNYGYRPITTLSFALENEFFGINSSVSHTINILLYFIGCALFLILIVTLFPTAYFGLSLAAVVFFLALPIHSEIVNNIKCRDELLMLIFSLVATWLWLKATDGKWWLIFPAILSLTLGILSKKTGLIFIGIIPTAIYFQSNFKLKSLIGSIGLLALIPIGLRVFRKFTKEGEALRIYSGIENPLFNDSIAVDPLSFSFHSLWFYFKKMVFTNDLVAYYGYDTIPTSGYGMTTIMTLIVLVILIFFALKGLKNRNPISFGIIIMLGGLLPFVNWLVPMVGIVAERFVTVATLGVCIFIPFGLAEILKRLNLKINAQYMGGLILIVYSGVAFSTIQARNKEWKNDETLFIADVRKEPNSATIQGVLGKIYLNKIPNLPSDQAKINMGKVALQHLEKSVSIAEDKYILTELGSLQFRALLNFKKAKEAYNRAIAMDSLFADPYYHLGWLNQLQKDTSTAISYFKKAIEIKPTYISAYEPLLQLLVFSNRGSEAIRINQKGLELFPRELPLILNQANIYFVMGDYSNALFWYEKHNTLQPNDKGVANKINQVKSIIN
jgi:tetratricopeptide (TPR) repeat protein